MVPAQGAHAVVNAAIVLNKRRLVYSPSLWPPPPGRPHLAPAFHLQGALPRHPCFQELGVRRSILRILLSLNHRASPRGLAISPPSPKRDSSAHCIQFPLPYSKPKADSVPIETKCPHFFQTYLKHYFSEHTNTHHTSTV